MASLPKCKPCNGTGQQPVDLANIPPVFVEDINARTHTVTKPCKVCNGNGIDQQLRISKEQAVLYFSGRMGLDNFDVIKLANEYERIISQPMEYETYNCNNDLFEIAYVNVIIDPEGRR